MKTILAIETSTAACSVALLHQGQMFHIFEMLPQRHAHRVLEMVDEVLQQAKVTDAEIDYLAYGEGPGAFTGIRIATGVIQGLALGWNKPVIAVSSLESMAFSGVSKLLADDDKSTDNFVQPLNWVALMDARMNEIYWQTGTYDLNSHAWSAESAELLSEELIQARLAEKTARVFGDIDAAYPSLVAQITDWQARLPSAKAVAELAEMKQTSAKFISEQVPLPVYLRNNVAETTAQRMAKKANQ